MVLFALDNQGSSSGHRPECGCLPNAHGMAITEALAQCSSTPIQDSTQAGRPMATPVTGLPLV